MTTQAFDRIAELMNSDDERVVLMAAKEILDRAWGRPALSDEDEGDRSVTVNIVHFEKDVPP